MIPEPERVRIVCGACNGTGWTTGYPGQRPQDDPGEYSCWACKGEKSYDATLAPGEKARIVREELAELVEEFEASIPPPIGDRLFKFGISTEFRRAVDWWRTKLAALGVASEEKTG